MTHLGKVVWLALVLGTTALAQPRGESRPQGSPGNGTRSNASGTQGKPSAADVVDRLRAQLMQPGPEGADDRELAIERLLSLPDERAHAVLRDRLANADDPDSVRLAVLQALLRRLINPTDEVFGQREDGLLLRGKLVRGYGATLAMFWQGDADADGLLPPDPLREQARACLVRLPVRPLEEGLRQVASAVESPIGLRIAALRAAGDAQNLHFGRLLADFLQAEPAPLQQAARAALRYLTFAEETFEQKEQFELWFQRFGNRRYLDLAEEAGRHGARRARQQRDDLLRVQQLAASDVVRTMTERRKGVDWTAVQARTLSDDAGTVRACLEQLRLTLADFVHGEDVAPRHAFARALLARYRATPADAREQRGLLLEVASYLCRLNEVDLAPELAAELLQQLGSAEPTLQLAALRGLRRFPSPDARAAVVGLASAALQLGAAGEARLSQALQTLSAGGETSWRAPTETAADRSAWLELVRALCTGAFPRERRNEALAVAMLLDREGKRVAEIFDLLLQIATDAAREPEYRRDCLVRLESWRDQPGRAKLLVQAHAQLLGDAERDVRLFAAEALSRLPDAPEDQKKQWLGTIVSTLRDRLQTEMNPAVLQKMLDCLVASSRDPGSPAAAIGALNVVLDGVGVPAPPDQQARADALLSALTTIAADPRADQGQWIGSCEMLLKHDRRRMLRHVLESHNAVLLAKDVRSSESGLAQRARSAMRYILLAALLKPAKESWQSTPELKREANDVRTVFDSVPQGDRLPENLQEPRFRLLRLDALLACIKPQEVISLATTWLEEQDPKDYEALSAAQVDTVRMFVAEAYLLEGKLDPAAASLSRIDGARATDARAIDLADKLGRALLPIDAVRAVEWLDRVVRATAEEDPLFRGRAVALWQARVKANPEQRDAVLAEIEKKAALFESPECPEELKAAIAVLRGRS